MIYSICLIFEKPDLSDHDNESRWRSCGTSLLSLANNNKELQLLGDHGLLLALTKGLDIFYDILKNRSFGLGYRYVILTEDIQWHVVSEKDRKDFFSSLV